MLTPLVGDELLHFSAGGLYNGLVLLIDDESRSYWDHISGACVHGARKGQQMAIAPLDVTTVEAESRRGDTLLARSDPGLFRGLMGRAMSRKAYGSRSGFPPGFTGTMSEQDERVDAFASGLGVVVDGEARFYLRERGDLNDLWGSRRLEVRVRPEDGTPHGRFEDGEVPFQLFTRWYGFSLTYPGCSIDTGSPADP